ncbi:glycosyltransferase family 28 C-terminal domain-containing protein [Amylocarpus encephaloides]|uniref:UDP-N-acetylglucosamine transferase subunit ALG13 n=1 Tax=Amylocarpus encephaloides TaxID=45428 RepID=A0A9P7YS58_9HELO|nr:glycosyltransferase family 28 C-terminal domain-containing protein [Amylocarpus encephaloides]
MAFVTIQAIIGPLPEFDAHSLFTPDTVSWSVTKSEGILSTIKEDSAVFIIPARKPLRAFINAHEMAHPEDTLHKECFLTIGATANFTQLLKQAVTEEVLSVLKEQGFTDLTLQVGNSHAYFTKIKPEETAGINIEYFDFNPHGLTYEMKKCQAKEGVSKEGLVVSHAGAGTILDAMRLNLPLIVVPNVSLLDNHQEELAAELEKQGYVVKSSVKPRSCDQKGN